MKGTILLIIILISLIGLISYITHKKTPQYNDISICKAIYHAEGGESACQPYGINPDHIKCNSKEKCKQICLNTVANNRIRYKEYGFKIYPTYLEFLQSRYCPSSENLCNNWLKNVKYFLDRP